MQSHAENTRRNRITLPRRAGNLSRRGDTTRKRPTIIMRKKTGREHSHKKFLRHCRCPLALALTLALTLVLVLALLPAVSGAEPATVLGLDDTPRYRWNKEHFAHTNPHAPKGGTLRLSANGNFDSFHPYIARGITAAGMGLTVETLGEAAPDYNTLEFYGLVAQSFEVAPDRSSVIFHINPAARFHDGTPITAEDAAFSFRLLTEQGAPNYRNYYASVERAEVLSPLSVRFVFSEKDNAELPVILAQLPVLPKHYWETRNFSDPMQEPPLGSGPYRVKSFSMGSHVEYERVPDYWGKDLPVNRGRYNFDSVRYEYYRDDTVAREAFKGGAFDLYTERTAKAWGSAYAGPALAAGDIVREEFSTNKPQGMYGFIYNTRRPVFADRRVRQALALAFDFEWTNRALFHGAYTRSDSFFSNSEFASSGLPAPQELALLSPFTEQLPPGTLDTAYTVPVTAGDGNLRPVLTKALALFGEAGWTLREGRLVNAQGRQMEFSLLLRSASLNRIVLPFRQNLERLGIRMHIVQADATQYVNRVRDFDYDMILSGIPQSSSPGNEQRNYWSSEAATTPGSRNYAGVRSPVVDALVEHIIAAPDRASLVHACRALDRVLLHDAYVIPGWYSTTLRVAYWNKFARSPVAPASGMDIHSWWADPAREAALRRPGAKGGE